MHHCRSTFSFILFIGTITLFSQESTEPVKYHVLNRQIDSVVYDAINQEAFPGCVIFVSHKDSLLLFKSYGYHTYDSVRRVAVNDIYDLASVTKVMGATLAIMKLYEETWEDYP